MHKLRLPIANPCHENWDGMSNEGGGRRFCDQCSKSVHDLSDMTEFDARALLAAPRDATGLCIRYTAEPSGKVRFRSPAVNAPTPSGFAGWRAGLAAGVAAMALSGCADKDRQPTSVEETHCNYEVGPFGYTLARGEGNCPALPGQDSHDQGVPMMGAAPPPEDVMEMGEIADEPPVEEMGKVAPVEEVMGEAPIQEAPCDPDKGEKPEVIQGQAPAEHPKVIKKMGKVAKMPEHRADPLEVEMGDVAEPID